MNRHQSSARQGGVALLLSLWALALLSLLLAETLTTVRLENRQSQRLLQVTRAELSAQAGLAMAVLHMSDPQRALRWRANGQAYSQPFDHGRLTLRIRSEMGKVDLNNADPALCARLARVMGASEAQARTLAAGLEARQADALTPPLRVLEEAAQLPGMNPILFERLAPYITVWSGYDQPVEALAPPPVRIAMGQLRQGSDVMVDPGPVLTIESQAQLDNGTRATLQATLLLTLDGGPQAMRLLRWQP